MYSTAEKQELERIAKMLMDDESLSHTQRLIVDAVIKDCEDQGRDLGKTIRGFLEEGLTAPH